MTPIELLKDICHLNATLWGVLKKWEGTVDEINQLPVSRLVFKKLKAGIRPTELDLIPFSFWDRTNAVVVALQMAANQVKKESFNGIIARPCQRMSFSTVTFARQYWRFWLKVAKRNPEICVLFSGLPKAVVQALAHEDFDSLGLEQFLVTYPQRFILQGSSPIWFDESRDAVQDALGDWLWAEEDSNTRSAARAKARLLRLIFSRDTSCDLIDVPVSFQSTPQAIDAVFDFWNCYGVGRESCFRMLSFCCGTTQAENRRRWRATSHPMRKEGIFQFPSGIEGQKIAYVFEKVMGRGITSGLSAPELMHGLPVVALYAFFLAGHSLDESKVGCMTSLLEKKYRQCFEQIRVQSLALERRYDSPQRITNEERGGVCA